VSSKFFLEMMGCDSPLTCVPDENIRSSAKDANDLPEPMPGSQAEKEEPQRMRTGEEEVLTISRKEKKLHEMRCQCLGNLCTLENPNCEHCGIDEALEELEKRISIRLSEARTSEKRTSGIKEKG